MTQNRSALDIGVWLLARKITWNYFPVGAEFGNFVARLKIWNSAHAGHPSLSCQQLWMGPDIFFNHQQKYSKSLVLLAARGSHGPQQFSGWKYPPPHRGLAMVNVKRAICLALFWDLFTNFHKTVYFDSCTFSLLASPPKRVWDYHNASLKLLCFYYCCVFTFLCILRKLCKLGDIFHSLKERLQITHIISAHDYSQQQIHPHNLLWVIASLWGCTSSWELRFIIAAKTYDPINMLPTFGSYNPLQQEKHLSSQTWCDEVFQLAVREHHSAASLQLSKPQKTLPKHEPMVILSNTTR